MSLEPLLFERLKAGVPLVNNRVYARYAKKGVAVPYIVFFTASNKKFYSHDGLSNLSRPRVQISCYANSNDDVLAVVAQVNNTMDVWHLAERSVQRAFHENEVNLYDERAGLWHIPLDYFVWYEGQEA